MSERMIARLGAVAVMVAALAACTPGSAVVTTPASPTATSTASPSPTPSPTATVATDPAPEGSALEALNGLTVRAPAKRLGYDRKSFGSYRSALEVAKRRDIAGQRVFTDPYTGERVHRDDAEGDHVVSLADAHDSGAWAFDGASKNWIANDPINLVMTDGAVNGAKSDQSAATWLPPLESARCEFVARQITIKGKNALSVTREERDAMAGVLATCPAQPLIVDTTAPATPGPPPSHGAESFKNCAEARAAGVTPLRRGDPGYATHLDRDGDGIACAA